LVIEIIGKKPKNQKRWQKCQRFLMPLLFILGSIYPAPPESHPTPLLLQKWCGINPRMNGKISRRVMNAQKPSHTMAL